MLRKIEKSVYFQASLPWLVNNTNTEIEVEYTKTQHELQNIYRSIKATEAATCHSTRYSSIKPPFPDAYHRIENLHNHLEKLHDAINEIKTYLQKIPAKNEETLLDYIQRTQANITDTIKWKFEQELAFQTHIKKMEEQLIEAKSKLTNFSHEDNETLMESVERTQNPKIVSLTSHLLHRYFTFEKDPDIQEETLMAEDLSLIPAYSVSLFGYFNKAKNLLKKPSN